MAVSFSAQVKQEILDSLNNKAKYKACISGMILCCKTLNYDEIEFITENPLLAVFFTNQIEGIVGCECINKTILEKKNGSMFLLSIDNDDYIKRVFEYCGFDVSPRRITEGFLAGIKEKNIPSLIGGMFLSCGSVIDPNKEYHLEFVFPNLDLCNDFGLLLIEKFNILAKHTSRKNNEIVYLKESECIEDMLTIMGATMGTLEIMNVKILKDVRNKVNRTINCDHANIDKSLKAAEKQIADIELIVNTIGLGELTEELREMAQLRLENPDYNLKDLGQALSISRSGANHRLKRLAGIAAKIREEKGIE